MTWHVPAIGLCLVVLFILGGPLACVGALLGAGIGTALVEVASR